MSRLEELIQQLCPNGVEYKQLVEVCKLSRGKVYSKDYLQNNPGDYPVYSSQTANNGELGRINTYDCEGDFLTWTTDGAYAGTIFHRKGKFSITNVCGLIKVSNPLISIRFLYYWLTITAKAYVYQGMGNPKLMTNQIEVIPIPLLPLPIQEEIVRILDTFTESTNNLKEQIQTRRKQYEYYRDQLLDLEGKEGGEMKALGEICEFRKERISSLELSEKNYVSVENLLKDKAGRIDSENIPKEGNWSKYCVGDILIGNIRPYLKKIWLADRDGGTNGDVIVISPKNGILPKYLYNILSSEKFFVYYNQTAKGGKMPRGDKKQILVYPACLHSCFEQTRIVTILDQFEASIANLEAQLKQREKQYEYYRNHLLTFKKKEV